MKTIFIAINSKYIHSALAPWYLKACCGTDYGDTFVREFTINDNIDSVLARIYGEQPDVAAFSCYIWNIEFVLKLISNLKKVLPDLVIILGGPEVSFNSEEILKTYDFVDFVLSGEGEISISKLIELIYNASGNSTDKDSGRFSELQCIPGLVYRNEEGGICSNSVSILKDLDNIPFPYTDEMLSKLGNRIVYYESSRGCPFSCSYCLSSISKSVRFLSMERIRRDITRLAEAGVKQIKFVDRTFNCNRNRSEEILRFIIGKFTDADGHALLNFHFEVAADLFDDGLIEILAKAPHGLIQLEIGVQSVNTDSLEAVKRKTDLNLLFDNFYKLRKSNNIHLHLDLIAGLPFEDYKSFISSFNRVYAANPHQLQLGFLKLLKGSELRRRKAEFGYVFREYPPYEVLSNNFIKYDEMAELKGIEDLVDRYYNSGRFVNSLAYLISNHFRNAFDFYKKLYNYFIENDLLYVSHAMKDLYTILYNFSLKYLEQVDTIRIFEYLRLDFLASDNSGNLPLVLKGVASQEFKENCFAFLKSEVNIRRYLPEFTGVPAKAIIKHVHFEPFNLDVLSPEGKTELNVILFDYNSKDAVTGLYRYVKVDFL